jgi:hypothetical protein
MGRVAIRMGVVVDVRDVGDTPLAVVLLRK